MPETHEFEDDLRNLIQRRQVVAVVGSGVSMATNRDAPTWRALFESAIKRCRTLGATDRWCRNVNERLDFESDEEMSATDVADALLSTAEEVHRKLCQNGGDELASWLRKSFENLKPADRTVIRAIAALDIPLVTTNYDLIEKVTKTKHLTWKDARNAARVLRNEDRRVLHLHGHWDEPDSVVLGIRSYESVLNHQNWYGAYEGEPQTDPTGPQSGRGRVLRGGSWFNFRRDCRSAFRNYGRPVRTNALGFRVART